MNFDIGGINYYVEISGKGNPIVLLHGFTGNHRTWEHLKNKLSDQHLCIAIDIIGHGKTDSPNDINRYKIDNVAEDIILILKELNISKTIVLGYSMGGRLAITMAVLYPNYFSSLILESTTPGLKTEDMRMQRTTQDHQLASRILAEGIEWFVSYWENIPMFSSQKHMSKEIQEEIRLQRMDNSPLGLANSLIGMGTGSQPSWWDEISKITIPVLLITGSKDKKFCDIANEMKKKLTNCINHEVSDCGHAIHVEEPEKFGKIVSEFLSYSHL